MRFYRLTGALATCGRATLAAVRTGGAVFQGEQKAIAAISFVNQANDSKEHKRSAQKKFVADLASAIKVAHDVKAFVFFTNVNLTVSEKDALVLSAKSKGLAHCEVIDRERMRLLLDGPDGLSVRFQSLDIPMSEAEQATFFARWGDEIQKLIAEGFDDLKKDLRRLLFLHEAPSPLDNFIVTLQLDREYQAAEIGHFRCFCSLSLREPKNDILMIKFGRADRVDRCDAKSVADLDSSPSGIGAGIMGIEVERKINRAGIGGEEQPNEKSSFTDEVIGSSKSMGQEAVKVIGADFGYDTLFRLRPYLRLSDLDGCMLALFVNRSLLRRSKRFMCTQTSTQWVITTAQSSLLMLEPLNQTFYLRPRNFRTSGFT